MLLYDIAADTSYKSCPRRASGSISVNVRIVTLERRDFQREFSARRRGQTSPMTLMLVVRLPGRSGCRNSALKDPIYKSDLTSPPCWPEMRCAKDRVLVGERWAERSTKSQLATIAKILLRLFRFFPPVTGLLKEVKREDIEMKMTLDRTRAGMPIEP